ncbi:HlyD family secretion protein [Marinihelvus fidelis]|uniref:HlyD family secretion protein n=1 Tax=Marinihelvus fidelis TaxID=2613842 RepID=A0A5N0TBC8_9GAMM|nr:HlyD family secretion protein [Marinihelvus fidelis]KAA9131978.1 HlyD family secretion protein [Marinihelvus fidelis]
MNDEVKEPAEQPQAAAAKPKKARDPVRRATLVVLVVIALLLAWYLRADRVTPYTSQARVNALVVPVASDVAGRVTRVFVGNNQWVNAGDPLFEVDVENYRLAVETAEANYQAARQAVGAAEAAVEAANAGVAAAVANLDKAQKDYDRTKAIHDQDSGAISMRRVELEEASLAIARSQLDAAKAQREQAIQNLGDDGERNVRILQAKAALDQAQLNLSRATTKAPSDGVVTDVRLDVGNFAGAGAPQMTFVSTENVWLEAEFTENNLGHLDPGDPVAIVFDAIPGRVISGKVREVGYGVAVNKAPLGQLPTIRNDPNWLRQAQRYPVLVDFERPADLNPTPLKVGSQASLVVYTDQHPITNGLGAFVIRMVSWLTYAY